MPNSQTDPNAYKQVIVRALKSLSHDGHTHVTGQEVVVHLASSLGILKRSDLHKILEEEVRKVIHEFYPGATMYTAIYAAPKHRQRIILDPDKITLGSSFTPQRSCEISHESLQQLFNIASSCELDAQETAFIAGLGVRYPWLLPELQPTTATDIPLCK